jgi:hypothetical protein
MRRTSRQKLRSRLSPSASHCIILWQTVQTSIAIKTEPKASSAAAKFLPSSSSQAPAKSPATAASPLEYENIDVVTGMPPVDIQKPRYENIERDLKAPQAAPTYVNIGATSSYEGPLTLPVRYLLQFPNCEQTSRPDRHQASEP